MGPSAQSFDQVSLERRAIATDTARVYEWFERERGIRKETLDRFNVQVKKTGNVVFPYVKGEKERPNPTRPLREDERRFYFTSGLKPGLYNIQDAGKRVVFITEGESDTLRLWQAIHDDGADDVGVVGISGTDTWNSAFAVALTSAQTVFAILDNDDDYMAVAATDRVWRTIRSDLGPRVRRLRLPDSVKDVCEFFDTFDLDTLRMLAKRNKPGKSRFNPLDLTKDPPPINWLVEGLIAKGDTNLFTGEGGLGKSWTTMCLAVAIAEEWDEFLGLKLNGHGRILYIDEENPEDVVYHRLKKLGLTSEGVRNVRYLHNQGIRLDRNIEALIDEAMDYNPVVIVLDSLTRLHGEDENSAGSMARIMNDGVKALARETGAAVILIHHVTKSGFGDSYKRSRGSVDIVNSVDAGLDFQSAEPSEPGVFVLKQYRSRRKLGGDEMVVRIADMPDGAVQLLPSAPLTPPF